MCEPALICKDNGVPVADQPVPVFSEECQLIYMVLGCEQKSAKGHQTLMESSGSLFLAGWS